MKSTKFLLNNLEKTMNENTEQPRKGGCLKSFLTTFILLAILDGLVNACFSGEDEDA